MTENKTTLKSLKVETEKFNKLLPNIQMNNINEFNELIYAGTKLASDKIGVLLKKTLRNITQRRKIRKKDR